MSALLEVSALQVQVPVEGTLRPVLHDVTFWLAPGEALGIVGESGSGKSMTLRAIARLLPPRAQVTGSIRFDGEQVLSLDGDGLRRYRTGGITMIFQDPRAHINPVRTVGDFLTEGMRAHRRMDRAAARRTAVRLLSEVGIEDGEHRLRQYPHELSGGLLQRVMIAAAVATRPRLILADEPTTALDVTTQSDVMAVLDRLRRERGLAMIFVTHDLELAASVCDRTAVMYAGSIVEQGTSSRLHDEPMHPYTDALVRARPDIAATTRRAAIPGQPLPAYEAPSGCAFAPRCGYADVPCTTATAVLRPWRDGWTRCARSEQIFPFDAGPGPGRPAVRPAVRAEGEAPMNPVPGAGVEVSSLRKEYRRRGRAGRLLVAVDDVSFAVPPGGSLAIVGESGSGKTTVARMIVGLERPTSGAVSVGGRDRSRPARSAEERRARGREVQIVFQDPYTSLDRRQSVQDCIGEVLRLHFGMRGSALRERVEQLGALVGLEGRTMRSRPRALSGGQRQRVAIARALAAEPSVLILDESVAALDVSIQAQVLNLLADIRAATGVSYVFISHDLAAVRQVAEQAVVMHRGRVVECGPVERILDHPRAEYTRLLLAGVPRPGWRPLARGERLRQLLDSPSQSPPGPPPAP